MTPSDWIDEGDGVFRGGGVKGLALASALGGFAEHPEKPVRRWVNVAGSSAGAIIACYLAVHGDAAVQGLERLLADQDFSQFADYPRGGRLLGGGTNLILHHGLASGDAFLAWFDDQLGGATFDQVRSDDGHGWRLKLVAVDVTTQQLLLLPDDLDRYKESADGPSIQAAGFPIARAARMSMSIPYFFEPVTLYRDQVLCVNPGGSGHIAGTLVDRQDAQAADERSASAGRRPATWREVTLEPSAIIDGGTLSNFPVWIFDVDPTTENRAPKRMTFGFTLTGGRGLSRAGGTLARLLPWPVRFGIEIFHTAQSAWDTRFASRSTRVRTVAVDAADVATTDFHLDPRKRAQLIANGRAAARGFLDDFDPADYTNTYGAAPADAGAQAG